MTRMTKYNARQILQATIDRFERVTGERVTDIFTPSSSSSTPSRDLEMATNIESDLDNCSVRSLRSMISWIIQKSTGITLHFWGKSHKEPIWWPRDILFQNIAR